MDTEQKQVRSEAWKARDRELAKIRAKRLIKVYVPSVEDKDRLELMAAKAGYSNMSAWVVQMLFNAAGGSLYPPEYVEGLKSEVERLRRWLESAREEADDYKQQVKRLQSQRDSLLALIHGLPNGADVAARFLQQASGVQG